MIYQDTQAKIDKRIALAMKRNDEWERINDSELTPEENMDIRVARRLGYAVFFPSAEATLKGARKFLKANL